MNLENFYTKIIESLVHSGFLFSAKDFSTDLQNDVNQKTDNLIKKTEIITKIVQKVSMPIIEDALDIDVPSKMYKPNTKIDFNFNSDGFQNSLNEIKEYVDFVCFKYVYSQPVIVAVIGDSEHLTKQQKENIFLKFDQAMLSCREFTSSMKAGFSDVKMSVTGILLWSFNNTSSSQQFFETTQAGLTKMHFWKKVNTLSWYIDIEGKRVCKHKGLPIIVDSILNVEEFKKFLFS